MKTKPLFLVFAFSIITLSCEKMEFKKDISGTWKSGIIINGNAGTCDPVNFTHLVLKKSYRFSIYNYDTLKVSGEYSVKESSGVHYEPFSINFATSSELRLSFPFNKTLNVMISRNNDTLVLVEQVIDGLEYCFTKK
jgi:hypothetical protein